jgi:hypothetical protein
MDRMNHQIILVAVEVLNPKHTSASDARIFLRGMMAGIRGVLNCTVSDVLELLLIEGPSNIDPRHLPPEWFGLEPMGGFRTGDTILTWEQFTQNLPCDVMGTNRWDLLNRWLYANFTCARYHMEGKKNTRIVMSPLYAMGDEYHAMFEVFDDSKKDDPHKLNWHGQNTSQWTFAGCIVMSPKEDGKYYVSMHT